MAKKEMMDEFDAVRDAQALREMSDDASAAKRAMDQSKQMDEVMAKIKAGKAKPPMSDDMGPLNKVRPVKMPELKTKDTGDRNSFDLKGEKIPGYENSKPMKKGGKVKKMATGGKVAQLAKANGCATKGKSKGRIV
jgi:hypothetical protein